MADTVRLVAGEGLGPGAGRPGRGDQPGREHRDRDEQDNDGHPGGDQPAGRSGLRIAWSGVVSTGGLVNHDLMLIEL
jgi:hypothetical protein